MREILKRSETLEDRASGPKTCRIRASAGRSPVGRRHALPPAGARGSETPSESDHVALAIPQAGEQEHQHEQEVEAQVGLELLNVRRYRGYPSTHLEFEILGRRLSRVAVETRGRRQPRAAAPKPEDSPPGPEGAAR